MPVDTMPTQYQEIGEIQWEGGIAPPAHSTFPNYNDAYYYGAPAIYEPGAYQRVAIWYGLWRRQRAANRLASCF